VAVEHLFGVFWPGLAGFGWLSVVSVSATFGRYSIEKSKLHVSVLFFLAPGELSAGV
jgi:hypothetical protein